MSKRKFDEVSVETTDEDKIKKHTLDSDEEDSADDEEKNVLDDEQIEGEELGEFKVDGNTKVCDLNILFYKAF